MGGVEDMKLEIIWFSGDSSWWRACSSRYRYGSPLPRRTFRWEHRGRCGALDICERADTGRECSCWLPRVAPGACGRWRACKAPSADILTSETGNGQVPVVEIKESGCGLTYTLWGTREGILVSDTRIHLKGLPLDQVRYRPPRAVTVDDLFGDVVGVADQGPRHVPEKSTFW